MEHIIIIELTGGMVKLQAERGYKLWDKVAKCTRNEVITTMEIARKQFVAIAAEDSQ